MLSRVKVMEGAWRRSHCDVFASGHDKFFVAREKGTGKNMYYEFSCYDSVQSFYSLIKKRKGPSYHELVPSWRARRIHFDLDCNIAIERDSLITDLIVACSKELLESFNIILDPTKVIVLDSSKEGKVSVHVILTSVVALTPFECRKFCTDVVFRLRRILPEARYDYASYLDMAIYDKNRCFRLPLCTKRNQARPLLPIPFDYQGTRYDNACEMDHETLFTMGSVGVIDPSNYDQVHYDLPAERQYEERIIGEVEANEVIALARTNFTQSEWECFDVGKVLPGCIELKRTSPGPCRVCRRVHDRLDAKINVSESGRVNFVCWGKTNDPEYMGTIARAEGSSFSHSSSRKAGDLALKYLSIDTHYESARSSSDYIAALIEKYGYVE